ncbi:MAG: alpha/beta hydrolase family protein [Christensenellales bacterium]
MNKSNHILILVVIILVFFSLFTMSACQNEEKTYNFEYEITELVVKNGNLDIYGRLYLPICQNSEKPLVILAHSANLTSDSLSQYAVGFAKRGFIAYAFDFCGGSSNSRSGGNQADMTVFSECDDLKAVIDAMTKLENVDENSIYLFGTSMGGLVCALTAEDNACIKGEILLYPAFNIPEIVSVFSSFGNGMFNTYGQAFCDTLKDFDVYDNIGEFGGNVLIIHGSNDFIVNSSYSQRAANKYEHCTLKIIENAGHGFNSDNYSIGGEYDDEVWQFIDEYFTIEKI